MQSRKSIASVGSARKIAAGLCLLVAAVFGLALTSAGQGRRDGTRPVVVAHLSDLHIGLQQNPMTHGATDPEAQLKRALEVINARGVDAIIVTGDIGENPSGWPRAREILKQAKAPVYVLPGNHDTPRGDPAAFRDFWGKDYFSFRVRDVEFIGIDSQLLGNYDNFNAPQPADLSPETAREAERMLAWLAHPDSSPAAPRVRIAVQHVPIWRGGQAPDAKVYWTTHEPWRTREIELLRKLGVRDLLAGHWHKPATIEEDGFAEHVAPSVGFASTGVSIGFAIQTIGTDGSVKTELVPLNYGP